MRLLADSHVLIWWVDNPAQLTPAARAAIADPDNEVFMSAASLWEIGLKVAKGKLRVPANFAQVLRAGGFADLPVHARHAERAIGLPAIHGDPFDRMLVAQAIEEGLALVSWDQCLRRAPDRGVVSISLHSIQAPRRLLLTPGPPGETATPPPPQKPAAAARPNTPAAVPDCAASTPSAPP
jgi:PIN domain nuclease of toxin-antitoxin system